MLEHSSQCPLSLPCPGWEDYYKPWDGRKIETTRQCGHQLSSKMSSGTRSAGADDEKPRSAGEDITCVDIGNIKVRPSVVKENAYADEDVVGHPSWALDVDGYLCFVKHISEFQYS